MENLYAEGMMEDENGLWITNSAPIVLYIQSLLMAC